MSTTTRADAVRIGSSAIVPGHVHGTEDVVADHGALLGLGDDDHPQYLTTARGDARYYTETEADTRFVNTSGDMISGQLEIRDSSLYLHNAGSDHVRLKSGLSGGGYALRVEDPGNAAILLPITAGNPRIGADLATVDWARSKYENYMISGPHGPLSSYETVQHVAGSGTTVFSTALHFTCPTSGICRLTVGGYSEIRNVNAYSKASLSAFVYPYGRWHDGTAFSWTNSLNGPQHRHTETKKAGTTSGDYGYRSFNIVAWFVSRPGARCSLGMQANVDNAYDGGVYANFGHMRLSVEMFSNGTFGADDSPAWGVT